MTTIDYVAEVLDEKNEDKNIWLSLEGISVSCK
jgi:hypothetical protein